MEGTELIAFNIIATVGTARSSYINAIDEAAEGNFEKAEELIIHLHGQSDVPQRLNLP